MDNGDFYSRFHFVMLSLVAVALQCSFMADSNNDTISTGASNRLDRYRTGSPFTTPNEKEDTSDAVDHSIPTICLVSGYTNGHRSDNM